MTAVAADAFINCRVSSEMKALVRVLADRDGITESQLVKDMLEAMLRSADLPRTPTPRPERFPRDARVYVRLTPADLGLLTERASARRLPAATYVSLLLRSHLHGLSPLPKVEYAALKEAVSELSAIGRDLNQIARVMNEGGRASPPGRADVAAMLKVALGLRDHFKALLRANARSWTQGPAVTASTTGTQQSG